MGSSYSKVLGRALKWGKTSFLFLLTEGLLQIGGFLFGVWIIRSLSKDDYAAYAVGSAASAFAAILVNSGMNVGFKKIGGRVFADPQKFRQLYTSGVELRKKQSLFILPLTGVVVFAILFRQGHDWVSGLIISILILLIILPDIARSTQIEALLIQRQWPFVQSHNLVVLLLKVLVFGGIILLVGTHVSIFGALGVSVLAAWLGAVYVMHFGRKWWSPKEAANPDYSSELKQITRKVFPNAVFFSVQNQMGVLLLGILGSSTALAGFGVLSRLTIAFGVFTALFTNIFSPAFSRCHDLKTLRFLYFGNIAFQVVFSLSVVIVCSFIPGYILQIFGSKYSGLEQSLYLAVWLAVLGFANTTILRLNQAKGWIDVFSKWSIPLTVVAFAIAAFFCNVKTLDGVLLFTILTRIPSFCLRITDGILGLKQLSLETAKI